MVLWQEEYLTTLRELTKNYCEKTNLKKGDVVLDLLAYKEKSSRSFWPLPIEEQAFKGRVTDKKTKFVLFGFVILFPPKK